MGNWLPNQTIIQLVGIYVCMWIFCAHISLLFAIVCICVYLYLEHDLPLFLKVTLPINPFAYGPSFKDMEVRAYVSTLLCTLQSAFCILYIYIHTHAHIAYTHKTYNTYASVFEHVCLLFVFVNLRLL